MVLQCVDEWCTEFRGVMVSWCYGIMVLQCVDEWCNECRGVVVSWYHGVAVRG